MQLLQSETVRYISAHIDRILLLNSFFFIPLKHNQVYFLVTKRLYWVNIVIYAYICCILLYMFALMLIVCYQYKAFVNIGIVGLYILLSNLNCTKAAVYFSNHYIASLSLM